MAGAGNEGLRFVGHKGADLICPGNTVESFVAGAVNGADTIEVDVLWTRDGDPRLPAARRSPLICAHDWDDAAARPHLTVDDALEAFTRPPLDRVEINLDLKLLGREDEIAAAVARKGLTGRAMISTTQAESIRALHHLEPQLRLGWSYPRVSRDWTAYRWAVPGVLAALAGMRLRLPRLVARNAPVLHLDAVWVYHRLVTRALSQAARGAGIELNAWTVDDLPRMRELVDLGVTGIVSNDPRLFDGLKESRAASD